MNRWFAFLMGVGIAHHAIPQECPGLVMIQEICTDILDHRIPTELTLFNPCGCNCPPTKDELRVRKITRDSVWHDGLTRFLTVQRYPIPPAVALTVSPLNLNTPSDEVMRAAEMCPAILDLQDICERMASLFATDSMPDRVQFELDRALNNGEDAMDLLPRSFPGYNRENGLLHGRIVIPIRILHDRSVGRELLTFILLHEVHHIIHAGTSNEHDADLWAASAGLFLFNGRQWPSAGYLDRIAWQLERYYESQIATPDYTKATKQPHHGLNSYPELACRLERIRRPCMGLLDAAQETVYGYPVDCWSDMLTTDPFERDSSLRGTERCVALDGRSILASEIDGLVSLLDRRAILLVDLCEQEPIFCEPGMGSPGRRDGPVRRSNTRSLGRVRRELDRMERKAARENNRIERLLHLE